MGIGWDMGIGIATSRVENGIGVLGVLLGWKGYLVIKFGFMRAFLSTVGEAVAIASLEELKTAIMV